MFSFSESEPNPNEDELQMREECRKAGKEILEISLGAIEQYQNTSDPRVQEAIQSFVACVAGILSAESFFLSGEERPALARIYNSTLWKQRNLFLDESLFAFAKIALPEPAALDLMFRLMDNCLVEIEASRQIGATEYPQREELLQRCKDVLFSMAQCTSGAEMEDMMGNRDHVEAVLDAWGNHPKLGPFAKEFRIEWTRDDLEGLQEME